MCANKKNSENRKYYLKFHFSYFHFYQKVCLYMTSHICDVIIILKLENQSYLKSPCRVTSLRSAAALQREVRPCQIGIVLIKRQLRFDKPRYLALLTKTQNSKTKTQMFYNKKQCVIYIFNGKNH